MIANSDDDTRERVRAIFRLELEPASLTERDVHVLGSYRDGLGVRAAVAYELHRVLKAQTPMTPSRRRKR